MALLEPAGGAAMMPDLQHKLSKKVAQLTKVIYHLNSKQEEHALDISELADQYETEIETILRDAADRLNWFKNQLDTKVLEGNNAQLAQELQARHDADKARTLEEFTKFKDKAKAREAEQAAAVERLAAEVESVKATYQAKLAEAQEKYKALKSQADKENASGNAAADAKVRDLERDNANLRKEVKAKTDEASEAIKAHNRRYNDMLAERLGSEEALKDELAIARARITELSENLAEAGTAQAGLDETRRALAEKEAQLDRERAEREAEAKRHEAARADAERSWQGKVETLMEEVARLKSSANDADGAANALRKRVGELELEAGIAQEASDKHAAEARRLAEELASAEARLHASLESQESSSASHGALEADLAALQARFDARDKSAKETEASIRDSLEAARKEAEAARNALDAAAIQHKTALAAASGDAKKRAAELEAKLAEVVAERDRHAARVKELEAKLNDTQTEAKKNWQKANDAVQEQLKKAQAEAKKNADLLKGKEGELGVANKKVKGCISKNILIFLCICGHHGNV